MAATVSASGTPQLDGTIVNVAPPRDQRDLVRARSGLLRAAPNGELLIALRALQGVGAALLTPGSSAILEAVFRREDRAAAVGSWSGCGAIAVALGPILGGILVGIGTWGWRLAFLVNVPLGVAVLHGCRSLDTAGAAPQRSRPGYPMTVLGACRAGAAIGSVSEGIVAEVARSTAELTAIPSSEQSPLTSWPKRGARSRRLVHVPDAA